MKTRLAQWFGWAGLALVLGCFSDYPGGPVARTKQGTGPTVAASGSNAGSKAAPTLPAPTPAPQTSKAGLPPPEPSRTPPAPQLGPTAPAMRPGQTPGTMTPGYVPPGTSRPSTAPAQAAAISLSAGVALPQTGPEGTMMGFSVDYQFNQGRPQPSEQFFWVIERSQGTPAKIPQKLQPKGTLQGFITTGWRPEQGPFRTHIQNSSGRQVSETADLRAP
jgi:hypothetical protein